MGVYSVRDAARILKVKPARLRYWKRTRLVRSREEADPESGFEFGDLVCVKAVLALLDGGVPLQRIRQSVEILRDQVPELKEPLAALRVSGVAPKRVVVRHEGILLEPDGQLVLEFESSKDGANTADVAPITSVQAERAPEEEGGGLTAMDWFEVGCGLDSDPASYDRAIEAYRNAVRLDPVFADAHCNLGAALYNKGDRAEARSSFNTCLQLQSGHVEARFNLANLFEEEGQQEMALAHYLAALEGDPLYADIHVSLALLYEKLDRVSDGRRHWRRYLQIEPQGPLADIARHRLDPGR